LLFPPVLGLIVSAFYCKEVETCCLSEKKSAVSRRVP